MIRDTRPGATQRNIWAQLAISACALLLPPMALGAAVYSLLPAREDGIAHAVAGTVEAAQKAATKFRIGLAEAWPIRPDTAPATSQPSQTTARPAQNADTLLTSALPASAGQAPAGRPAKDMARVLGPVPVRVTIVTPTTTANAGRSADVDSAPTGSIGAEPSPPAAPDVPAALLPRLPAPSVKPEPASPPQAAAVAPPATDPPSVEAPAAPAARKHTRVSYLRNLAKRNGVHAEARSEPPAARRNNGHAQPQQAFSLKSWLQQLGARPRNSGG